MELTLTEKDERRFWAKAALPNKEGCMLWMAATDRDGYGHFRMPGGLVRAHRISYTLAYGEIPEGLEIDHVKAKGLTATAWPQITLKR